MASSRLPSVQDMNHNVSVINKESEKKQASKESVHKTENP
jgi:hypothetical protein